MNGFGTGVLAMIEKQRAAIRALMRAPTGTAEQLKALQLGRTCLDSDTGFLVSPVSRFPLSHNSVNQEWRDRPNAETPAAAFLDGVRFAERRHGVGTASETVIVLPPAIRDAFVNNAAAAEQA